MLSRSYGWIPHTFKTESHDSVKEWESTSVPPKMTGVLEQLGDASSRPDSDSEGSCAETPLQLVPKAAKYTTLVRPFRKVMKPGDVYLTEDRRCNQNGKMCGKVFPDPKDGARHWVTRHVIKEVRNIERGKLEMRKARILNTAAKRRPQADTRCIAPSPHIPKLDATNSSCVRSPLCGI